VGGSFIGASMGSLRWLGGGRIVGAGHFEAVTGSCVGRAAHAADGVEFLGVDLALRIEDRVIGVQQDVRR
jgi:hypothetical protein